jgi:hypothetical protein
MAETYENADEIVAARRAYNETLAQAHDKRRVFWFPLTVVLLLLALPALQLVGNYNYLIHIVLYTLCYVTMASGWNIIGGFTGYISLGHNVFFAVGGYFAGDDPRTLRDLDHRNGPYCGIGLRSTRLPHWLDHIASARPVFHYLVTGAGNDLPDLL